MSPYIHSHSPDSVYSSDGLYSPPEHYQPKYESSATVPRFNSWSAYSHISSLLRAPHHAPSINPKVTILTTQPCLSLDVNTPSSASTQSLQTPSSPFVHEYPDTREDMDFESDSEDEDVDSDIEEMDGIEEETIPFYGVTVPQVMKSTSALEGALGDSSRSSGPWWPQPSSSYILSDRRMSVSAPGYATSSHRQIPSHAQRRQDSDMYSPRPYNDSSPASPSYPHHSSSYTHDSSSSMTALFAPTSALYQNPLSSSLADAIPPGLTPGATRNPSTRLPILQPQPIRPIPPIPLDELASSAAEVDESVFPDKGIRRPQEQSLSPLPLLCQPVSDAVRYQLSANLRNAQGDGEPYDNQMTAEPSSRASIQSHHFNPAYPRNCSGATHTGVCTCRRDRKMSRR
ncbi:hypothetical protein EV702DRAFT_1048044 [Suillus placidus]|uniref:Uncharacterized protein n=1 Tax=Suillus placidus TaxID=48579 RepID=A0A9P6ZPD6_9AGAM|nr:hypothetical protein EV702DRAFT_1048044 [Suillus placidus]